MEKISWTDRVKNEEVLPRVKEERNILHAIKQRKANWIGHILRRNCLLKHVIEGKIELNRRRGRRRQQLQDEVKYTINYWKFKKEELDRAVRKTDSGRGYGLVFDHNCKFDCDDCVEHRPRFLLVRWKGYRTCKV